MQHRGHDSVFLNCSSIQCFLDHWLSSAGSFLAAPDLPVLFCWYLYLLLTVQATCVLHSSVFIAFFSGTCTWEVGTLFLAHPYSHRSSVLNEWIDELIFFLDNF